MKKILLAGAIIDFYVNRKRFEAYKTEAGRKNYVYAMLTGYTELMKGMVVNGIEIRDVSITSNHFWGEKKFCILPDLKYSAGNEVPELPDDSKNIPIRLCMMDLVGIMDEEPELADTFFEIEDENYYLQVSNFRVV